MARLADFSIFGERHPSVGVFIVAGNGRYIAKNIVNDGGIPALLVFGRAFGVLEVVMDSDDPDFASTALVTRTEPIPEWERRMVGDELARLTGMEPRSIHFLAGRPVPTA